MKKYRFLILVILFFLSINISCNKEDECVENRKEDCFCADIYLPVCGCNGKTLAMPAMQNVLGLSITLLENVNENPSMWS